MKPDVNFGLLTSVSKSLARRFDRLVENHPGLKLVFAKVPKDIEQVEYHQEVDYSERYTWPPIPVVHGQLAPQAHFLTEPQGANEDGIMTLTLPDFTFPQWDFWNAVCEGQPTPYDIGIWSIWLHRDFGRETSRQVCEFKVPNPTQQISCLDAYAIALRDAGQFVTTFGNEMKVPSWICELSQNSSSRGSFDYLTLRWLVALLGFCTPQPTISLPKDKKKQPLRLGVIHDIGSESARLFAVLANQFSEPRDVVQLSQRDLNRMLAIAKDVRQDIKLESEGSSTDSPARRQLYDRIARTKSDQAKRAKTGKGLDLYLLAESHLDGKLNVQTVEDDTQP